MGEEPRSPVLLPLLMTLFLVILFSNCRSGLLPGCGPVPRSSVFILRPTPGRHGGPGHHCLCVSPFIGIKERGLALTRRLLPRNSLVLFPLNVIEDWSAAVPLPPSFWQNICAARDGGDGVSGHVSVLLPFRSSCSTYCSASSRPGLHYPDGGFYQYGHGRVSLILKRVNIPDLGACGTRQ